MWHTYGNGLKYLPEFILVCCQIHLKQLVTMRQIFPVHAVLSLNINPLPHMPILGCSNSEANENMMSKIRTNGYSYLIE